VVLVVAGNGWGREGKEWKGDEGSAAGRLQGGEKGGHVDVVRMLERLS